MPFPKLCSAPPSLVFQLTFSECLFSDLEVDDIGRQWHYAALWNKDSFSAESLEALSLLSHERVGATPCQECLNRLRGVRCAISMSSLSNESGEPTVQWANFILYLPCGWSSVIECRSRVKSRSLVLFPLSPSFWAVGNHYRIHIPCYPLQEL